MSYPAGPHLGSTTPRLVGVLNLRGNEPLTQSVYPAGERFVQAKALGEDTVIQMFTKASDRGGVPVYDRSDEQKLLAAGHGSQIAWWDGGVVFPHGHDPMWIRFRPGRFTRADATILHVGTNDYTVVSIDTDNDLAVLRSTQDGGKRERFTVTRWSLIQPGKPALPDGWKLAVIPLANLRGTFQGCSISGSSVYAVYGATTGKADYANPLPDDQVWAYEWDWTTGKQVAKVNYTTVSRLPDDVPRSSEPEAIFILELDGLLHVVIAVKSGSGGEGEKDEREIRLMAVGAQPSKDGSEVDMARSQNGWTAASTAAGIPGGTKRITPKGAPETQFTVRAGDVATVFQYLVDQYQARVEDIDLYTEGSGDDWGYASRPIRGSATGLSNHASATAIDINATRHPLGVSGNMGFSDKQIREIREILRELRGAVRWGGDYSGRKDGMHFEINVSKDRLRGVADDIRSGKIRPAGDQPAPGGAASVVTKPFVFVLSRFKGAVKVIGYNGGFPSHVATVQTALVNLGYDLGNPAVDGLRGPKTKAALGKALRKYGFDKHKDGDPITLRQLDRIAWEAEKKEADTQYPPRAEK